MSTKDNQTHENEQSKVTQAEEQQEERDVKEAELNVEGLEDRIAPATFIAEV